MFYYFWPRLTGIIKRILGKRVLLPCNGSEECLYEHNRNLDRDVEGMPFAKGDPRSCPVYGHVCPKFMEDFKLTVEELHIRAAIHCGGLLDYFVQAGEISKDSPEYTVVIEEYQRVIRQYPRQKFPQYY